MTTLELKKQLINKISGIDDDDILHALITILDFKKQEPFIALSAEQHKELSAASESGKNGQFISQSEMDGKVAEWLKEK